MPFGHGKHFLAKAPGIVDKLLGGWQLNGITTVSTGQYKTVGLPQDWMNIGPVNGSVPNKIGNPIPSHRSYTNYFNINAFAFPGCESQPQPYLPCTNAQGALHVEGDVKRNSLEEPGHNNWDMGLIKGTRIGEHLNTQFRAEAYNVLNHTQFGDASASLQPGSFGVIGSLGHDPRVLQVSLKLMF